MLKCWIGGGGTLIAETWFWDFGRMFKGSSQTQKTLFEQQQGENTWKRFIIKFTVSPVPRVKPTSPKLNKRKNNLSTSS